MDRGSVYVAVLAWQTSGKYERISVLIRFGRGVNTRLYARWLNETLIAALIWQPVNILRRKQVGQYLAKTMKITFADKRLQRISNLVSIEDRRNYRSINKSSNLLYDFYWDPRFWIRSRMKIPSWNLIFTRLINYFVVNFHR